MRLDHVTTVTLYSPANPGLVSQTTCKEGTTSVRGVVDHSEPFGPLIATFCMQSRALVLRAPAGEAVVHKECITARST